MSINDMKPMKYTDVGKGNFHNMMQQSFLKAHKLASEYGQRVDIAAKITVFPPDPRMPENGNHSFSVQIKEPTYVSQRFTTSLYGGLPISDGRTEAESQQLNAFEEIVVENKEDKLPEVIIGESEN